MESFVLPANGRATPDILARRRKLYDAMAQDSLSTAPVGHWTQAAAKIMQAMVGGYGNYKADQQESQGTQSAQAKLQAALNGGGDPAMIAAMNDPWMSPANQSMVQGRYADAHDPMKKMQQDKAALEFQYMKDPNSRPMSKMDQLQYDQTAHPENIPLTALQKAQQDKAAMELQYMQHPEQQPQSPFEKLKMAQMQQEIDKGNRPVPQAQPLTPDQSQQFAQNGYTDVTGNPHLPETAKAQPVPLTADEQAAFATHGYKDPSGAVHLPQSNSDPESFKNVTTVRKEIQDLPSYKSYAAALPIFQTMQSAATRDSKAADLNMVYGLAKIYDPTSVVREGETVMVRDTASLPDWLVGTINGLNGGARLQPETRKAMLGEAQSRITSYKSAFDANMEQYKGLADRYKINQQDIMPVMPEVSLAPPDAAPGGPNVSDIDPEAIQMLKSNPASAQQFDEMFGPGSAARILGK